MAALLAVSMSATPAAATLGVDVSVPINATTWQCFANAGVTWSAPRAWHSYGAFDNNSIANLKGAKAVGIPSDVYLFPCPGKDAGEQAMDMLTGLSGTTFGRVWIDVEDNPSKGCDSDGCVFLREMVAVIQQQGVKVGFYANAHGWKTAVGDDCQIQGEYDLPLWYAHYDRNATTCADFTPFAGWTKPEMKQYTDKAGTPELAKCGVTVDTSVSC